MGKGLQSATPSPSRRGCLPRRVLGGGLRPAPSRGGGSFSRGGGTFSRSGGTFSRSGGYTLIEVLVATLVLSVGIMGVAAVQMLSFQAGQGAYARSQAILLIRDIFERMRANPQGYAQSAVYDGIDTEAAGSLPANPGCATVAAGCTPAQMARQDVREWAQHFTNLAGVADYRPTLPNGRGELTRQSDSNRFTATISWDELVLDADGNRSTSTRSVSVQTELQ